MRRILILVALPLCLASARQAPAPVLSCETITTRTTLKELQQRTGDFDAIGLDITWADAQQTRMAALWTTDRKSVWRSANGIKVGMLIAELDQLNERAFQLSGFQTDDPGLILSWAGGKLEPSTTTSCRLVVRLTPSVVEFNKADWKLVEPMQSAAEVRSDDKRVKPYKAVVSAIGLDWR